MQSVRPFRTLVAALLGLVLASSPALVAAATATADAAPASPAGLTGLADYLAWAADHSPRLAEQSARIAALQGQARKAGALPGLKLAWGEMVVPVETRVGPQQRVFSVSQSLPWFGTLSARRAGLDAEAQAAAENLRGVAWQVAHDVRAAWYELAFIEGQIGIVARNLELARQTEISARARYESGEAPYAAVLAAQMELGRLDARLAGLRDRRSPATAMLNTAAGLPAGHPAPPAIALPDELLDAALPEPARLARTLRSNNPSLGALRRTADSRRQGVVAAGKGAYPDLTIGLDYIVTDEARMPGVADSGKDPVIARLAVSLPLWGGQAGAAQRASAGMLRAASENLAETGLRLDARLAGVLFAWRDAGRNLDLYGATLLPRSTQNLNVVTAGYEAGQADFDRLLAVRQEHLGLELALLRARTDRLLALNDLSALLGVSPEDLARGQLPPAAATASESE